MPNKADDFIALVKAGKTKEAQAMIEAEKVDVKLDKLRVKRAKLKDKLHTTEAKL